MVCCLVSPSTVHSTVLTGPLQDVPESIGTFSWGDGLHNLFQQWSVMAADYAGWVYGTSYTYTSNADVYVASDMTDPTTVADASSFTYTDTYQYMEEGDTVFFRGANGYYGAWSVADIYPSASDAYWPPPRAYLNGTWYFQSDGSGNFSSVPEPTALFLVTSCLLFLFTRQKKCCIATNL